MSEVAPADTEQMSQLVVIGSSAGGIHALRAVLATLPADFAVPIVIAQHLDPNRASQLAKVLQSSSPLPVLTVQAEEKLLPGHVYVVSSDCDVIVIDHSVAVRHDTTGSSHPSVDRLLASAARVFSEGLVAVVLTGMGSDGAEGTQAVKAYGGTVIVQNPDTARFPGMPESVPLLSVDAVAELDAIGPLLVEILAGNHRIAESTGDLRQFLDQVRSRTGLDFSGYKRATIERRLQRRMATVGAPVFADYRRYVDRHPAELQHLVSSFLIKVTEFFRDRELWDHLRTQVLPEVISQARVDNQLRLWSAGCATGEEAYSLAMLVSDLLDEAGEKLPVRIFATDLAQDAVEFARRGVYPPTAVENLDPEILERCFTNVNGSWEIAKSIREMVIFGEHDLGRRAPFPRIDLVLCRNVLIYFTPELQRRALQLFAFSLRRGGYLVLGSAESVSPLPEYFSHDHPPFKLYRRSGEQASPARLMNVDDAPGRNMMPPRLPLRRLSIHSAPASLPPAQELDRLPEGGSVGLLTVDRGYFVRALNGAARDLLGIQGAGVGEDLVHAVHPEMSRQLREVLDAALAGKQARTMLAVPQTLIDPARDLLVTCTPLQQDGQPVAPDGEETVFSVLMEVVDISELGSRARTAEQEVTRRTIEAETLRPMVEAAAQQARSLRSANGKMAEDLARLRAENDKLQVVNEESQAASEEIETLNEELQATNEELETLNEELHATVEELIATNDELQARSVDLQRVVLEREEQRKVGEAERDRIATVLATMGDAVLVVDANGEVVLTNEAYLRLFGSGTQWAPEDEQGQRLPEKVWPQRLAAAGETFTRAFTLPASDGERYWFEAKGQPISAASGDRLGLLVIRDITERSLRRQQEQFLAIAVHELRTPLTALTGRIHLLSRRLERSGADPWLQEQAAVALEQTWRINSGVDDLMDAARVQHARLQLDRTSFDTRDVLHETVETLRPLAEETPVRMHLPDAPVVLNGDRRRIGRVALNLIANSLVHASSPNGVDVHLRQEDETAVIEVEDHGPGIPADQLPRLFDRFYQGNSSSGGRSGLGLGLFIAKEIVGAHGGTIDASSVVGEGTVFTIHLPLGVEPTP